MGPRLRPKYIRHEKTKGDWFFDGYERKIVTDENGKQKKVFVYRGVYYGFGREGRAFVRLKLAYGLLMLLYVAVYLAISLIPFGANRVNYVAVENMWTIAPCVYLLMGVACLLVAKEKMSTRSYFGSVRRMRRALYIALPLSGATVIGDIVYLVKNWQALERPREFFFTAGCVVCFCLLLGIRLLMELVPCRVVEGPDVR